MWGFMCDGLVKSPFRSLFVIPAPTFVWTTSGCPRIRVRGRLLKSGMTEKAVYRPTLDIKGLKIELTCTAKSPPASAGALRAGRLAPLCPPGQAPPRKGSCPGGRPYGRRPKRSNFPPFGIFSLPKAGKGR